ncbi:MULTISPECIES: NAD(P)-dependent alcohol dehydrogenase [Methanosarcina]|uniref:Threonine dehydrogenase and related Zn-dependent dehydrogenase n=1 Tax=Methanosarcina barkeri MS TaxID=1434108 RepID=A0A0E3QUY7_METBA|nr:MULTISPECIES: NAD(P)-dependent alcohol dehydrogenase [Methanosarcina]AKB54460.1 Threonine dehydrogenase and related Zn-dependent dehydrogenase [Methanosarcina barkeri MS]
MKGFAMLEIGKVGWIDVEKPSAGPYDAIVRPIAVAPCTSDVHTVWEGALGDRKNMILGHEAVGVIEEIGSEVKDFKPGDKVIVPAITPEWRSMEAQDGIPMHSNGMLSGWKFSNFKSGVFAEFFHVNDADMNLALLPKGMPLEQAVMLSDMATTGIQGAEMAKIKMGSTVAVIGIGPVGLMAVAGATILGAGRLIAVGSRKVCVDLALEYGASEIVDYRKGGLVEQILAKTNGKGVDSVIISGGNENTISDAVKIVKPGGTVSNVNYYGTGDILPIPRIEWGSGMSQKDIRGGLTNRRSSEDGKNGRPLYLRKNISGKNGHSCIQRVRQNGRSSHAHERKTKRSDQTCCSSGLISKSTTLPKLFAMLGVLRKGYSRLMG